MGTHWIYWGPKQGDPKSHNSCAKEQRWFNVLLKTGKRQYRGGYQEAKNLAKQGASKELFDEPNLTPTLT